MLGRNRKQEIVDAELGSLLRVRGSWRGQVRIDEFGPVALRLPGSRSGPDDESLRLALTANDEFTHCRPKIEAELVDHRSPYEPDSNSAVSIPPSYVAVIELDHQLVLEFGYHVPWDEEHTLGARVREGRLIELCGSVVEQ